MQGKELKDNNLLLIIDLQNEFINENTNNSINEIKELINSNKYNNIISTKFINSNKNPTCKILNWNGCLSEESRKICINTDDYKIFDKETYSAYNNDLIKYLNDNRIDSIYLCGIDIECCVLITALNLFENGYNVYVLKDYSYCTNGIERKNNAIEILKRNIGKDRVI
jgi:nicotinamidase-related amidase